MKRGTNTITEVRRPKPKHPQRRFTIPTKGWEGNINSMIGRAIQNMKMLSGYTRDDVDALRDRISRAPDYNSKVAILRELFPIEGMK